MGKYLQRHDSFTEDNIHIAPLSFSDTNKGKALSARATKLPTNRTGKVVVKTNNKEIILSLGVNNKKNTKQNYCGYNISFLSKKIGGNIFQGVISLKRVVVPFPKIVIKLPSNNEIL